MDRDVAQGILTQVCAAAYTHPAISHRTHVMQCLCLMCFWGMSASSVQISFSCTYCQLMAVSFTLDPKDHDAHVCYDTCHF